MDRKAAAVTALAAVVVAGGVGTGLGLALGGGHPGTPGALTPASRAATYAYYQAVAKRYSGQYGPGGAMMGGSSMMGAGGGPAEGSGAGGFPGFGWMMGGRSAPGWMIGGSLPGYMMGGSDDMGRVMGRAFAGAPGPRLSAAQAKALGAEAPGGASVDRAANTITFSGHDVSFAVIASPSMPAEDFEVAGLTDPTLVVPLGARVDVEVVNADGDMAHGFVVSAAGAARSWMPMMSAGPAFPGSALWFLWEANSAGMHAGSLSFTAWSAGTYSYLCPVPGHAEEGMAGSFVVQGAGQPAQ